LEAARRKVLAYRRWGLFLGDEVVRQGILAVLERGTFDNGSPLLTDCAGAFDPSPERLSNDRDYEPGNVIIVPAALNIARGGYPLEALLQLDYRAHFLWLKAQGAV
jgi:hypothetical protein